MTVPTETALAVLSWTGVETSFAAGFTAESAGHVKVYSRDADDVDTLLTESVHYSVTLGAGNAVTVVPIALPAAPKTILIARETPATQAIEFENLAAYLPNVHTLLHDRAARRDAEFKRDRARALMVRLGDTVPVLPALEANKVLGVSSDGLAFEMLEVGLAASLIKMTDADADAATDDTRYATAAKIKRLLETAAVFRPPGQTETVPVSILSRLFGRCDIADFVHPTDTAIVQAFDRAKATLPASGGVIYFTTRHNNGAYVNGATRMVLSKTMRVAGDNRASITITTSSATEPVFEVANSWSELDGFKLSRSVAGTAGSPLVKVSGGTQSHLRKLIFGDNVSTAIEISAGAGNIVYAADCEGTLLPATGGEPTRGVGVVVSGGTGFCADQMRFDGQGHDRANQPYAGLDLSGCGFGYFTRCHMLVTGSGFLFAPTGASAVCTSMFFDQPTADNCRVGYDIRPEDDRSVGQLRFSQPWGCSCTGSAFASKPIDTAIVHDITVIAGIFLSNGRDTSVPSIDIGGTAGGSQNIRFLAGGSHYDNDTAAFRVGNTASDIVIDGQQLGNGSFPNDKTLILEGDCSVTVTNNKFQDGLSHANTATITTTGNLNISGNEGYEAIVAVQTLTGDQNDYAAGANWLDVTVPLFSAAADRIITGLDGGQRNARRRFRNVSSFTFTFHFESVSSAAENRINMPAHAPMPPGSEIAFRYDADNSRWKLEAQPASAKLLAVAALNSTAGLVRQTGADAFDKLVTGTGVDTFLATPSSANLAAAVTDETGSGALVFANTPTLVTPVIGAATGTSLATSSFVRAGGSTLTSPLTARVASGHNFQCMADVFSGLGGVMFMAVNNDASAVTPLAFWASRLWLHGATIECNVPLTLKSYTVATLPAGATGDMAYASNARVFADDAAVASGTRQGAGAGTGSNVIKNASAWVYPGTNVTAIA